MQAQNTTEIVYRLCATCREHKLQTEFWREIQIKTGRPYWRCKECQKARYRDWCDRNALRPKGPPVEYKTCGRCKEKKHGIEFTMDRHSRDGLDHRCRDCKSTLNHRNHRSGSRASMHQLWSMYRLRRADYDKILSDQNGRCAVCKESLTRGCIDHDHRTGKVRGILCVKCNTLMGAMDREGFLDAARRYLARDLSGIPGRIPNTAKGRAMNYLLPPISPE